MTSRDERIDAERREQKRRADAYPQLVAALDTLFEYCYGNVPYFGADDDREQAAVIAQVQAALDLAKGEDK